MSGTQFCSQCGQKLPISIHFCPYCGSRLSILATPVSTSPQKDLFYVFAVQGPVFGVARGDMVLEKAITLKNGFEPAKDMELKLVRPSMWCARVQSSSTSGMVSVSYSMDGFKAEIRSYLKKESIPDEQIEKGIAISEENSLQLSNPMSGVFVMGIPIIWAEQTEISANGERQSDGSVTENPASDFLQKAEEPTICAHQFQHFVCTKCGEKAPKPVLMPLGIRTQEQYTYEYYRADSAEEARYFLEQTEVTKPLYYVMVETPAGKWGRDKDGLFLERLCDFQCNLSLAQCEAKTVTIPLRIEDIQMAANRITDNYLLPITCGSCGFMWTDGVAYRSKTIVKCPECGKYNLADTENIHFNNL